MYKIILILIFTNILLLRKNKLFDKLINENV